MDLHYDLKDVYSQLIAARDLVDRAAVELDAYQTGKEYDYQDMRTALERIYLGAEYVSKAGADLHELMIRDIFAEGDEDAEVPACYED